MHSDSRTFTSSSRAAPAGIAASGPPSRAIVLGCQIDRLSMPQTLARCEELIARRDFAQHVAINAAKLVAMQRDPELRRIVEACELVSADGQSVVWASRLLGDPLPERVAGIDLMFELFALAERRGFRVFILGARANVLDRACTKVLARHPRLELVGARDGYFAEHEEAEVAEEVRTARPDILFVAMSSPRKEYWLGRYARKIDVPFVMGVGGAIDVVAGITRRAPAPFQRFGLEWAYRLAQEPRRLWRRYALTNVQFALLLAEAMLRRRRGQAVR
jgi:N-acetylglucosaminyldiphosphoundecaprenol N-acetyl-beta-D-mannosaminyltransferase